MCTITLDEQGEGPRSERSNGLSEVVGRGWREEEVEDKGTKGERSAPWAVCVSESVDSICRDSADTQYMPIQTNLSKSPKQLTYKPLYTLSTPIV